MEQTRRDEEAGCPDPTKTGELEGVAEWPAHALDWTTESALCRAGSTSTAWQEAADVCRRDIRRIIPPRGEAGTTPFGSRAESPPRVLIGACRGR